MESIFFMLFEIATPTTTVTVVSGEPGTAKSMRFKRIMQSLSPGIIVQGGNKSARAGMQGTRRTAILTCESPLALTPHPLHPSPPQATTTRKTAASSTPTR